MTRRPRTRAQDARLANFRSRPPRRLARVMWPDGAESVAPSWDALLQRLADDQWDEMEPDEELRDEMAWRAKVWSDTRIDRDGTARQFFAELERAGMLTVMEDPDE